MPPTAPGYDDSILGQREAVIERYRDLRDSFYIDSLPKEIYDNAHCAVILSSTIGAVTILDGIPTFVDLDTAFVSPWSAGELKDIESPNLNVDRNDFLKLYAKCHWSVEEIKNGTMWKGIMEEEQIMINVFVGYDSKEKVAFNVLSYSILKNSTKPVSITPIYLDNIKDDFVKRAK